MTGREGRINQPIGRSSDAKVRHLQRRLWRAAKQSPGRRFHALYDRIHRDDVLWTAWERVRAILGELGLELHPEKTRRVELTEGKEGFDFLGCHLHKRMSGRLWERYGRRRYYLQRWPSQRSMRRLRQRVKELVGPHRNGVRDVRILIRSLNPLLRGWGNYFRTGNAARRFHQMDTYVWCRLRHFLVRRKGRNLHAGEVAAWTRDFFWSHGLHRLRGTVRYPEAA